MATKTISLSEDAYERLRQLKRPGESFSDVVQRLTGRENIQRFVGAIGEEMADDLRGTARDLRERLDRDARQRGS